MAFQRTASMASGIGYSNFVPSRRTAKTEYKTGGCADGATAPWAAIRIQNLHSLNVCAPHKY